jgi:redox-sensitive bicupin YhaK (pirin superfamily)
MSWIPDPAGASGPVDLVVEPSSKDLGGFSVRRALPSVKRRMVGPFVFFDHIGPAMMKPGTGIDVRPHPHIGLATLTYLTEGSFVHRDSLGSLPADHAERAVYVLGGEVEVAGERFGANRLLVFRPGDAITLAATAHVRLLLLGGEPMDGPRHLWWNFVSSSTERIAAAKADWQAGRFGVVPDDPEYIPLPE